MSVKIAYFVNENCSPSKKNQKYIISGSILIIKRLCENRGPLINEFTLINVNLDGREAMKYHNLDEVN